MVSTGTDSLSGSPSRGSRGPTVTPSPPQRSWRWMWPGWIRRRGPVRPEAGAPRVKQAGRASSRTSPGTSSGSGGGRCPRTTAIGCSPVNGRRPARHSSATTPGRTGRWPRRGLAGGLRGREVASHAHQQLPGPTSAAGPPPRSQPIVVIWWGSGSLPCRNGAALTLRRPRAGPAGRLTKLVTILGLVLALNGR
jgi:hypothetical protein